MKLHSMLLRIAFILIVTSLISACSEKKETAQDHVSLVRESDTAMNAAMAKARETMPLFLSHFQSDNEDEYGFTIKVMVTDSFGIEHLWVRELEITEDGYRGVVANNPEFVKTVSLGENLSFSHSDISDWAYVDSSGVRQGSYTLQVILPRLPKEQAEKYRKMFRWDSLQQ